MDIGHDLYWCCYHIYGWKIVDFIGIFIVLCKYSIENEFHWQCKAAKEINYVQGSQGKSLSWRCATARKVVYLAAAKETSLNWWCATAKETCLLAVEPTQGN